METKDRNLRLAKFARAEQLFRQLIEGDARRANNSRCTELYVNMGNAASQAERLGPAIAAYRRALALAPQQARAQQNLAYARSLLPDWIRREETYRLIDSLFFSHTMIPSGQLLILGAGCFLVAAVLVSAGYARRHPLLRNLAAVPAAGLAGPQHVFAHRSRRGGGPQRGGPDGDHGLRSGLGERSATSGQAAPEQHAGVVTP